jgi:hypothetical protein
MSEPEAVGFESRAEDEEWLTVIFHDGTRARLHLASPLTLAQCFALAREPRAYRQVLNLAG